MNCHVEGCERPKLATKDYCSAHQRRFVKLGTPTGYKRERVPGPVDGTCSLPDCSDKHEAKGYCRTHYVRWKRWGDPYAGRERNMEARECGIEGCSNQAIKRGWCGKHYQRWRKKGDPEYERPINPRPDRGPCHICDCHRPHKGYGLCDTHLWRYKQWGDPYWAGRWEAPNVCNIEGCETVIDRQGLCKLHMQRKARFGDPLHEPDRQPDTCTVEGCDKTTVARGWCGTHYTRWSMWGDVHTVRKHPGYNDDDTCLVEHCPRQPSSLGYCSVHYQRLVRHGDPEKKLALTYDREQPSFVYVIQLPDLDALKVGIGAVVRRNNRLAQFTRHGWETIAQFHGDGVQVAVAELAALHYLRDDLGLQPWLNEETMPQTSRGGWTETVQLSEVPVPDLLRVIQSAMAEARLDD